MPGKSAVVILTLLSGAMSLGGFAQGPPPDNELLNSTLDPSDAITREFSFFNDPPPDVAADAVSREFSFFNGERPGFDDAVSREFSFFNGPPPEPRDAISREFSFFSGPPPKPRDAVSREFSFFNGCTSDADCAARPPCTVDTCHNPCTSDTCGDSYCTRIAVARTGPPNCAVDARQLSAPNCSNPAGWDSVEITFNQDCDGAIVDLAPGDFIVYVVPDDGTPPLEVEDVSVVDEEATLRLSSRIPTGKWTCVDLVWSTDRICLGCLPADVNADRTAAPADILGTIDNLNGQVYPSYPIWQCDVDRSGLCAPADILRVIDLLNGADCYERWLGRTLPECPSAP